MDGQNGEDRPPPQLTVMLPPVHRPTATPANPPLSPMHIYTLLDDSIPPPKADFSAPPPYDVAANSKLPSYEEVQREKQMQGESIPESGPATNPGEPPTLLVTVQSAGTQNLAIDNETLGTDLMFFTAFFVAFVFNWIGFLVLLCFCHTIASRYGALAGFGLSLAKWTLIVKHSTELAIHDNSWLCWLIMAFGILICLRSIIQYLYIKRGWRILSGNHQERLLFFY